ncbi:thioredoxin domain-containing protein 2-like [Drosophila bipectinata]|uniref:thioredoxin domain-containing protein 2-like n=1 Tax=Drosophila bipectinata TaxID=42026 RepID=UPI0038B39A94
MEHNRVYHLINFFERLSLSPVHLRVHYPSKNPLLDIKETPSIPRNLEIQLHQEINQNMPENISDENAYKDVPKDVKEYEKLKQDSEEDVPNKLPKEEDEAIESKNSEEKIDSVSKKLNDLETESDTNQSPKVPQQEFQNSKQNLSKDSRGVAPNESLKDIEGQKYANSNQDLTKDSEEDTPNKLPKEENEAIEPKSSEEKIDCDSKKLNDLETETDTINSPKGPQQEYEQFIQDPPEDSEEDAPNKLSKEEDEAIEPKSSEEKIDCVSKKLNDLEIETSKQEEPSRGKLVYIPDDTKNCFKSEIFREHLEEILRKHLRSKRLADAGKDSSD